MDHGHRYRTGGAASERGESAATPGKATQATGLPAVQRRPAGPAPTVQRQPAAASAAVVQRTPFDRFGQAATDATRNLICDLTSPVVTGSTAHYRLGQHGDELWDQGTRQTYQWTLYERASNRQQWRNVTDTPEYRINAIGTGAFRVEVVVLGNGTPSPTAVSMDLDVVAEDPALTAGLAGASAGVARTMRELVNDFRSYIIEGAAATGPDGITPRMLAGVLFVEVLNRPKEGRESELADVDGILTSLQRNEWVLFPETRMDHSLGVGQIRPATAAMAVGATPIVEQDRTNRDPARSQIGANFAALDLATKRTIFAQLQWPKSNIALAARLLAQLKNRPHRYPAMTRAQFAADQTAVGVVATEYNSGGTSTPAASAGPADYGTWVWNNMHDSLLQQFFPNT